MKLDGMETEELQELHRKTRAELAAKRAELDEIEAVLIPQLNRESAVEKLARAGLSPGEVEALKAGK